MRHYRTNAMNLRSVIKNAIASRLEESQIQEVQETPEVKNTFDFVKHLSEAIKFKLEELSKATLQSYKAKAEQQTKGPKGEKRKFGIAKAKGKLARKEMGLDRDNPVSPSRRAANLATHGGPGSSTNRSYIKQGKKNKSKDRMPLNPRKTPKPSDPNRPGVRGKTVNTSRGSGQEGKKADANQTAFNALVSSLGNRK